MKGSWKILALAAASSIVLVLAYNNCGTPKFTDKYGGIAGNPLAPTSNDLLYAICGTITKCNSSVTISACQSGILGTGGADTELGLPQGVYPTYSSIVQAEQTGSIVGNTNATNSCYSAISNLSCSDSGVQGAYNSSAPNPYANFALMIPVQQTSLCENVFTPISGWNLVDGGAVTGINFNNSKVAQRPNFISFNSKLYATWREIGGPTSQNQVRIKVYNGNDSSPAWASADGGTVNGINRVATGNAYEPKLVVVNSKLYDVWQETNPSGVRQMRASVYNGNDAASVWTQVDGGGTNGLNFDPTKNASWFHVINFNSKLYAIWYEEQTSGTSGQIRVKVYNGNDATPGWSFVDGGGAPGINFSNSIGAEEPNIFVFNSKLYATWEEFNSGQGGNQEIRAKVFNGNDGAPVWSPVDGGVANGLNFNPLMKANKPQFATVSSKLYLTWSEYNSSGVQQLRVKAYNGNDSAPLWTFVDGNGPNGINRDATQNETEHDFLSFNSQLYITWTESQGAQNFVHVDVYNGSGSSPSWASVDGAGINKDPSQSSDGSQLTVFNSKLYLMWSEITGAAEDIRSAVGH